MRIRTIKPEFWTSETIHRLSSDAKLLAIGLLNYADDEGYFWANPNLIRSALLPFREDSGRIPGMLRELSEIGFIRLGRDTVEGRAVGLVCSFTKHQRISKPTKSKIRGICEFMEDSESIPGGLPEDSAVEQGTGNRERGTGNSEQVTNAAFAAECESVWQLYPRKSDKKSGLKAIAKAIKAHGLDLIKERTIAYAKARQGQDAQFTPYAARFYGNERFLDDPATWVVSANPAKDAPKKTMLDIVLRDMGA